MTPVEAQPSSVWELVVFVGRRISKGCRGVKCSKANPECKIASYHESSIGPMGRVDGPM